MNFINTFLLRLAMLPQSLYEKLGVNTWQLYTILHTKLTMDNRRPISFRSMGRQRQQKESNNSAIATAFVSLLMGCLFLMAFTLKEQETQMTLYFGMMIFMLASILISDFTSVLIDVRDNYIILPKPISDRTVVLARVLHIMLHVLKVVIPMSLPGIICVAIMYGTITTLIFIVMVFFCTLFTLFLINLIYVLILKIVPPERFKTVISFVQILLAIVVYGGYQVVPRMINKMDFDFSQIQYIYLLPPYWFAAAIKAISTFSATHTELISGVLAFVFPVVALYVMIRFLAPSFNRKISEINTVSDNAPKTVTKNNTVTKKSYSQRLADVLMKDKTEKTGFLFSWKIGSRSRDFYMKVYPAFGYLIVMFFVFFFNKQKGQPIDYSHISATSHIVKYATIFIIYFTGYILLTVLAQISFSDKYKASWLFYTTPLREPGKILSGTFKSIVMKFYFPVALALTLSAIGLFGWQLLPNLFLAISNVVLNVGIIFYFGNHDFPFSSPQNMNAKSGNFMKNMFRLVLMGICGVVHYFIFPFTIVVMIALILSLIANWLLLDSVKKISWEKISANED
ncbi:hypothetical protein A9P82_15035 [Arachidicoccus ginsenosidimutans]|uniref:hypothetical protein n=1 Tax=Arachidicoccus sp. BS20 TaxID=1850526 RepID=UPI0007F0731E|nr:hypothetical protein [Arachidicoccus sp. BS20]ANI90486.1 hypothetical protein A9P82_15035 [Arachidicoccus sp. BS20]